MDPVARQASSDGPGAVQDEARPRDVGVLCSVLPVGLGFVGVVGDQAREVLRGGPEDEVGDLRWRRWVVGVGEVGGDRESGPAWSAR